MAASKCFKPMFGFCASLEQRVENCDHAIRVGDREHSFLCKELNNQYYTYLVISDSLCHEIVCAELCEGLLVIDREIDGTARQYWPCGASVRYEATTSAIQDMSDMKVELPESECEEELFTGEICNGNCTVHFKDGVAVKETPNKRQIQDGCYDNPVPTYEDGKLVALAEGSNPYINDNGCCG